MTESDARCEKTAIITPTRYVRWQGAETVVGGVIVIAKE